MKNCPARLLPLLAGLVLASAPLAAQTDTDTAATPPSINEGRIIVAPPAPRPLGIAVYTGPGAFASSIENMMVNIRAMPQARFTMLAPEQVGATDLAAFDVIVFCGGSGSAQSKAIGDSGRANVRKFVENGGGYVGVCAGAYLACSGFDWGLGILNARTVSSKWRRGRGYMDVELSDAGRALFGPVKDTFKIRYANGPIIRPHNRTDLPAYEVVAWFRSEIAENGTPVGVMVDSPAQATTTFGKGRVFISSPHPENTPGVQAMIPRALYWAAGKDAP
ncbi:Trehalose utilization [Opitutaceae bacterium TAV1]|nr:Trehalose utilization [Opitutaceae bacterium TAV1]